MKILAVLLLLPLGLPQAVGAGEITLGFRLEMGTYTVPVYITGVGERSLTFDTGASYTVLDEGDIARLNLKVEQRINIYLPHEGKRQEAHFATIPEMIIGDCTLLNRRVVVLNLPEGRPGALGMNDLEALAPFTFTTGGRLQFACPE